MGKESLPQGNYFAPKGIIKYKAEFPQDFSLGARMQSCFSGMVSPGWILCLGISVILRKKCYCCRSHTGELLTLCTQDALWSCVPGIMLALALAPALPGGTSCPSRGGEPSADAILWPLQGNFGHKTDLAVFAGKTFLFRRVVSSCTEGEQEVTQKYSRHRSGGVVCGWDTAAYLCSLVVHAHVFSSVGIGYRNIQRSFNSHQHCWGKKGAKLF